MQADVHQNQCLQLIIVCYQQQDIIKNQVVVLYYKTTQFHWKQGVVRAVYVRGIYYY